MYSSRERGDFPPSSASDAVYPLALMVVVIPHEHRTVRLEMTTPGCIPTMIGRPHPRHWIVAATAFSELLTFFPTLMTARLLMVVSRAFRSAAQPTDRDGPDRP